MKVDIIAKVLLLTSTCTTSVPPRAGRRAALVLLHRAVAWTMERLRQSSLLTPQQSQNLCAATCAQGPPAMDAVVLREWDGPQGRMQECQVDPPHGLRFKRKVGAHHCWRWMPLFHHAMSVL